MVAAGRIEPDDAADLVDHLQAAADMHGGGRHHIAILDDAELGGAASDVDVEDALGLVVGQLGGAGAISREHRFHVVTGGGGDEIAALLGQQSGDGLGVLAPQRLAGEDDHAGVDVAGPNARRLVGTIDDGAERGIVDARLVAIGGQRDRRLEQGLARDHVVAAGEVLAVAAQIDAGEDDLRSGRADVDPHRHQRDVVLDPDRIFFQRSVGVALEMVVVVIGIAVVLVHEILAEDVIGERVAGLLVIGHCGSLHRMGRACAIVPASKGLPQASLTDIGRAVTLHRPSPPHRMDVTVTDTKTPNGMSAEAYIARLGERGIEYVFANAGTDFAPIVEALSQAKDAKAPRFMVVPHENVAMAMAHGYYRIAGKPAAVMVHVTVGTANAINGIINAARDNIPILLAAGRTPITETGSIASRNRPIHWGQEAFDQGGMLREYVKWDYELRAGQPVAAVVDRALDIAMSEPRGPVYLTLPREVLTAPAVETRRGTVRPLGSIAPEPARAAIEEAAGLIAAAELPLIVTSSSGRVPAAVAALAALAEQFALPVVQAEARDMNLPTDHPMHLGHDPGALLPKADVVIVIDSVVPWMPRNHAPRKDAKVIHISADPLETRYPFRELEADLLVTGSSLAAMTMLRETLAEAMKGRKTAIESRRKALAAMREELDAKRRKLVETVKDQTPIHPAWLAACINQVKSEDAIVVSELGAPLALLNLTKPSSFMGGLLSGGLGFGLGAGLGAKLAAPEREVIVTVGDGSYMFGNPVPYHYVARAEQLPTLTVVANNQSWLAVRQSTLDVFPDGHAAKANVMALTELKPSPDYEKVIETCGGRGEKVEGPQQLVPALRRGLDAVRSGTPTTLNVLTQARR